MQPSVRSSDPLWPVSEPTVPPPALDSLRLRAWVRLRRSWLDWLIAHGEDPSASPALALRARQLTTSVVRSQVAAVIEAVLRDSAVGPGRDAAPWPERDGVHAVRRELGEIAALLRDDSPVFARGVAMSAALVCEWQSPLFADARAPAAALATARAARALNGHI